MQLDPSGLVVSEDGYLIGAGALHPSGWVYRYENGADTVAELPADVFDLLVELGGRTRAETRRRFSEGEPIPEGKKSVALHVSFQSPERTLSDEDARAIRERIVAALAEKFGAELRA